MLKGQFLNRLDKNTIIEGNVPGCTNNATVYESDSEIPRCPEQSWLVMVLFSIYLLLTNILLINLLIAMFSYTFNKVQDNSEKLWRFYRYSLIKEYFVKPTLAPPLIIFSILWRIGKYALNNCNRKSSNDSFRKEFSKEENRQFADFERACMKNYFRQETERLKGTDALDYKLNNTGQKVEKMLSDVGYLKDNLSSKTCIPSNELLVEMQNYLSTHFTSPGVPDQNGQMQLNYMQQQMDLAISILKSISSQQSNVAGTSSTISPVNVQHIEIRDTNYKSLDV